MTANKICPKCQGVMGVGNYTGTEVDWEKDGDHAFLKQSGQKITTFACEECGYLESYVKNK